MWIARSARAAFAQPMTYPIIAAVAVGGFIGGHVEGAKPAKAVHGELVKVVVERDRMAKQLTVAKSDLNAALERVRFAEQANAAALADVPDPVTATVAARPRPRPMPKAAPKAEAPGIGWPFKF